MSKPGQGILIAALVVLLVLLAGLTLTTVAELRSSSPSSSALRALPFVFLVLGVLIIGVVRTLRD
jgi:hypothetical protein